MLNIEIHLKLFITVLGESNLISISWRLLALGV